MPRSCLVTAIVMIGLVLNGCQTPTKILREDLTAIRVADVLRVVHAKAPKMHVEGPGQFVANRVGGVFGIVGGLVAGAIAQSQATGQGDNLVQELELSDPVVLVRDRFLDVLKDRVAIRTLEVIDTPVDSLEIDQLKQRFGSGLLLTIKTSIWAVAIKNLRAGYRVSYHADAALHRLDDDKLLWRDGCHPDVDSHAPASLEELRAENGRRLKERFTLAAERCVQELTADFFHNDGATASSGGVRPPR
jgi:hypothetical protein